MRVVLDAAARLGVACRDERDDDIPFLRALYVSTRAEEVARTDWPVAAQQAFLHQQFDFQRQHYRAHYQAEWLVIERAGTAIGRLYLARWPGDFRIVDIALLPEARGSGIGGAILADVIAEAVAAAAKVSIHVEHANPARRLYHRLGFVEVEEDGPYIRMERPPVPSSDQVKIAS
ncbi:GNAT family N-acetyltransferase [Sphingomonas sp.]|uniref:GNAT family N-acetyltransferase n=1 Tax=Sphingomonas sp. TaxID=28214 RepID=UPI002C88F150|nr:GNAT family N-acetyltransferase [Sphingomonas sp.]HWK34798.1 GNAT family N-acetyltransferase [Sphingomonas sp.]